MNRALGAATAGVLLLSPLALSACSAGQVTQTNTQERDKVGAMAQVGDITVRAVELESPRGGGGYEAGDDAEMTLAIVNSGQEADTLVGVDGEGFGGAEIESSGSPATGADSGSSTGTGGTTTGGSGSSTASDEIEIPSDTTVFVDGDEASITLTDLDEGLNVGQYLEVTLSFEDAGDVTVLVTVANPEDVEERGEAFDFHQEEEGGSEGTEDTARERESAGESAGDSGADEESGGE
ncbi:copper chaperone PCu(A)C [Blastococcus litoris]|uniref:copper chaperone PCu(A)C n=1 Tax=Blastococcus litoris TaxID=2171622 RepID=UPI0013E0E789|nr:copper chaperone PCu(A)C [Blastococcus litoris]